MNTKNFLFLSLFISNFIFIACGGKKDKSADVGKAFQDKINALIAQNQQQGLALKAEFEAQTAQLNKAKDDALASCNGQVTAATNAIKDAAVAAAAAGQDVNTAIRSAGTTASANLAANDPCTNSIRQFIALWTTTANGQYANTSQGLDYALNFFKLVGDQGAAQLPPYMLYNPEYKCSLLAAGQSATGNLLNQAGYGSYTNLANSYYSQTSAQNNCQTL